MIQRKVCMLGSSAVGKTSLIRRFVYQIFSDQYLTTVGVRIDRKTVQIGQRELKLILWDLHGDDEFQRVRRSYLRGAHGYFLVADGTRQATLDQALLLQQMAQQEVPAAPFLLLLNKFDLEAEWEVQEEQIQELREKGWNVLHTSAKSGLQVEQAFTEIARAMIQTHDED